MWKSALPQRDRYALARRMTRQEGEDIQMPAVSQNDVLSFLGNARTRADSIRSAIGLGNAVEVEFDDEYQSLFD